MPSLYWLAWDTGFDGGKILTSRLDWQREGRNWSNCESSEFVLAGGLRWHVQRRGSGPLLLLVHGTGASTHSWRELLPLLATRYSVLAPDLPGHGFTDCPAPDALSMPGMARALAELLQVLGATPAVAVGHSAGVAVLARMCLDRQIQPSVLVSLNGAMLPQHGFRHPALARIARSIATAPSVARFFAWRATADPKFVARLMHATGSQLDPIGTQLYQRLASSPQHVGAALSMMAMWDPRPLASELSRLAVPLLLVVGSEDRMILPRDAQQVQAMVPGSSLQTLQGLGHLAHEERPGEIARLIFGFADLRGAA
jgi:magnesium chelatase accessory protein